MNTTSLHPTCLLEQALLLACQAHFGQKDKSGSPYILHPLRLAMQMETETLQLIALLHDTVEDSDLTLQDLREAGMPKEVVEAVDCLTRRSPEEYSAYMNRLRANPLARRVKLADLEDNMNICRLSSLEAEDVKRLQKYLKVWRELKP